MLKSTELKEKLERSREEEGHQRHLDGGVGAVAGLAGVRLFLVANADRLLLAKDVRGHALVLLVVELDRSAAASFTHFDALVSFFCKIGQRFLSNSFGV